jgi:uncharacterized glyoxalase superfamily protein PhnB
MAITKRPDRALKAATPFEYAPAPEAVDHVKIADSYPLFIGGKFVAAHSRKRFPTINPATEEVLSEIVEADDVDVDRAVQAGAAVRYPLEDAFWGDRYGKITDPFGHEWGIATRIKEMTHDEMRKAGEAWMAQMAQA